MTHHFLFTFALVFATGLFLTGTSATADKVPPTTPTAMFPPAGGFDGNPPIGGFGFGKDFHPPFGGGGGGGGNDQP